MVNKFLWAINVIKIPAQYDFGPAYWHHFSLVTKNMKVYIEVVGRRTVPCKAHSKILFVFYKFICVYYEVIFSDILWKVSTVFGFCPKDYFGQDVKKITVLEKIFCYKIEILSIAV